jgi:CDP-diacylglycerol--glycerol-3-phosphate 3-phosphatidyltransferase
MLIFPVLYLATFRRVTTNWIALGLFVFAGITDHLDGFIARRTGTESSLGGLLDLIADKLLICIPLFYLLTFSGNKELLIPALIIISRELIISSFRQFLVENLGSNPIKVSFVAKSKTTIQITALSFLIISPNFEETFFKFTVFFFWLAAYISLHSLYTYFKAYKNLIK